MYIIRYSFLVPLQPKDKYEALTMLRKEFSSNLCPEEYLEWREFKENPTLTKYGLEMKGINQNDKTRIR